MGGTYRHAHLPIFFMTEQTPTLNPAKTSFQCAVPRPPSILTLDPQQDPPMTVEAGVCRSVYRRGFWNTVAGQSGDATEATARDGGWYYEEESRGVVTRMFWRRSAQPLSEFPSLSMELHSCFQLNDWMVPEPIVRAGRLLLFIELVI
ncbi:hypothetical protein MGG_16701 [Pyricularia oryzae 70-15]|uniref:Uncharacterized protein n=2 Tax=Pyricularia oryzae TaxID=318829 RepID=G4N3N3_PYRO7|nr:uncharacterized protein MGG_16701 [Pyricularia oryzae 70-15]EHA51857.1 hypothetical protein MGG_16701 [Pyricularia oryzae 70-15]ELQ41415.1 hypothetical protein OOU_Y34scaffold00282g2 [Pyricularia oryzae Y34]